MRRALAAVAVALLAGCGGDGGPSAEERRAAMSRWLEKADAACRAAEQAIVARGEPLDALDVDRIVARASADLDAAAQKIRRLGIPPGGEAKVKPVLAAIDRLQRPLDRLGEWSEVTKLDEMERATEEWRLKAVSLERAARDAGLKVCGRPGQRQAAADAIIAPVFAAQLSEFVDVMLAEIKAIRRDARVTDRASLARYLDDLGASISAGAYRFDQLDPPLRAANAAERYGEALYAMGTLIDGAAKAVRRKPFSLRTLRGLDRRFDGLARRERRAYKALIRALRPRGSDPVREPSDEKEIA